MGHQGRKMLDALLPLHPLAAYDFESNEFQFLNARRGKQRVEYLCYTSGRSVDRVESAAQNALLAELLDMPVDDARRQEWQARSHAEESASAGITEFGTCRILRQSEHPTAVLNALRHH